MSVFDLIKPSPDRRHTVDLIHRGEYSQGNFWYAISLDGVATPHEAVDACAWSDAGPYVAIAIIPADAKPADVRAGRFAILVVDARRRLGCTLRHPEGLGLLPQRFAGTRLVAHVYSTGDEWSVDVAALEGWVAIDGAKTCVVSGES